ncbi:hypothetical protein GCM10010211_83450 [Streptomyces albospinus]|uniref:TipAS antibiotic-recognition domain-containing protein n=2 Tax=Streptomyces albospinus TaxID=285515 RepID=A0ABQ2VNW0_9ACTN|nr:hypothetical protein GCM10010211_83450 [Streptomyces albospinus]
MTEAELKAAHRECTAQMILLAELMVAGLPADVDAVQAHVEVQYGLLSALHAVSVAEYRAIGRSCVDNEQWRTAYEAIAPSLAAYQRDAIEAHASRLAPVLRLG